MTTQDEKHSDRKGQSGPGPLILTNSGLFFTASALLPKGIKKGDIESLVRGMVEERAPLPLEQTSWGYLTDPHGKSSGRFLYYAATRQSLFGRKAEAAEDLRPTGILPSFAALAGLRFSKKTWVFLEEKESLSAVFFDEGASIPSRVISRFVPPENPAYDTEREKLIRRIGEDDPEADILPGKVRIAHAEAKGKGAAFQLEHQKTDNGDWGPWKKTGIEKENRLRAADVRDRRILGEGARLQTSAKRIARVAALLGLAVATLGLLEIIQFQRGREATQLAEKADSQEPLVERLQGIETITKSLEKVFDGSFKPFDWMMVFNAPRPETIHFTSFALDDTGGIRINGQAPEVKALNDLVESLQSDPRLAEVRTGETQTDEGGVRFSLIAETGDLDALPPEPDDAVEEETPPETEPSAGGEQA